MHGKEILTTVCDAASLLAGRLGLGGGVQYCLEQQFERWDGKGPRGLSQEDITFPARLSVVATQAALWLAAEGPRRALAVVQQRAGGWFDPAVADVFGRVGPELMRDLEAGDPWQMLLESEPAPVAYVGEHDLDRVARCFADMVDLKSRYTLGHSSEVARLAEGATRLVGLGERESVDLRRAALLHDLGRVGVSSGIWEKSRPLTRSEREQIRMHPFHTERILACSEVLQPLGRIAGLHHERLDGSGYHHGLSAPTIPLKARILAVADAFQTATQSRPHRPATPRSERPTCWQRRPPRAASTPTAWRPSSRSPGSPAPGYAGTGRPASPTVRSRWSGCSPPAWPTGRSRWSLPSRGVPRSTTSSTSTPRSATRPVPRRRSSRCSTTCCATDLETRQTTRSP